MEIIYLYIALGVSAIVAGIWAFVSDKKSSKTTLAR